MSNKIDETTQINDKDKGKIIFEDVMNKFKETTNDYLEEQINNIDFSQGIPDGVRYKEVENFMKAKKIEISRKTLNLYIEKELMPKPSKTDGSQAIYSKEHIYKYCIVNYFKSIFSLEEIKNLLEYINPLLEINGYEFLLDILYDTSYSPFFTKIFEGLAESLKGYINELSEKEFQKQSSEDKNELLTYHLEAIINIVSLVIGKFCIQSCLGVISTHKQGSILFPNIHTISANILKENIEEENRKLEAEKRNKGIKLT